MRVIETLDELAGRVVDNGGMAALPDLEKKLHDEPGFACTGVSHDLDMLAFDVARDTHRTARFEGLKSQSSAQAARSVAYFCSGAHTAMAKPYSLATAISIHSEKHRDLGYCFMAVMPGEVFPVPAESASTIFEDEIT